MSEYTPCGGCGADNPSKRCIGCFHDFGGDSAIQSITEPRTPEQRAADRREIEKLHPGERFQMMLGASYTPETDAEADLAHNVALDWDSRDSVDEKPVVVHVDFARRLERERNEARKSLYTVREALCDALPGSNHPTLVLVFMLTAERGKWKTEAIVAEQQSREALHECDQLRARVAELEGIVDRLPKTNDGFPILVGDTVFMFNPDHGDCPMVAQTVSSICSDVTFPEYEGDFTIVGDDIECGNLECFKKEADKA